MFRALRSVFALAGLLLLADTSSLWAALDAAQKQTAATLDKGLTQIESNLKLAQDAAGAGTAAITGSKTRLVQSRLAQAKTPLEQVNGLLKSLPADDPQVAALKKRADAAGDGIAAIEARLGDKPAANAPARGDSQAKSASGDAVAGNAKLDYKQEQLAKEAQSYLDEVDGLARGTAEAVDKIKSIRDQTTVDHQLVESATSTIAKARQRAALVKGRLDQLPASDAKVAALNTQYRNLLASLDASDKVIGPLQKKMSALVDPGSYPNLEPDFKRVQDLALMYEATDVLNGKYERAAALVSQAPAAAAEADRFAKTYAPLVQQKTPQGERLDKIHKFFQKNHTTFMTAATQRKQALPAEIEVDLTKANQMAEEAVAEQKPSFFQGGIPQVVGFAEDKLILLTALDPNGAATMKSKLTKAKEQLKTRESSLKELIISANELPPDRYTGKDKAALEELALVAWKKSEPNAEVLAVRFPSAQWERDTLLRYENRTWRLIDHSKIQAQLLVKQDGKLAVIRPINLWADHLDSDKVTASPMDNARDPLPPQRYLLVEKIK